MAAGRLGSGALPLVLTQGLVERAHWCPTRVMLSLAAGIVFADGREGLRN